MKRLFLPVIVPLCAALLLWGAAAIASPAAQRNAKAAKDALLPALLPGATHFTQQPYTGSDDAIQAIYQAENGCVVQTVTSGYAGPITMLIGVTDGGRVSGLVVCDLQETLGLGSTARSDVAFLSQYLYTTGNLTLGVDIDALTGATVTSKAVTRAVNAACAYITGADVSSGATEWGG